MTATARDSRLAEYVLGKLADPEAERVEHEYLAGDEAFDEIAAIEDELLLAYARNELPPDDRRLVDERLLRTEADRARLDWAKTLAVWFDRRPDAGSRESGVPSTSLRASGSPELFTRFLLPLAALLAIAVGGLLIQNLSLQRDIERTQAAQAAAEQLLAEARRAAADREALARQLIELQAVRSQPPDPVQPTGERTIPVLVSLSLTPGLVRGAGSVPRIDLSSTASALRVQLALPDRVAARAFEAALLDADGRTLWSGRAAILGSGVTVDVPAARLPRGDYEIVLRQAGAAGPPADVAEYDFSVIRSGVK